METKICTGCNVEKTLEEFSLHPGGKFGRNPKCRQCKNEQARVHYENNVDAQRERDRSRNAWFPRYGITWDRYLELCKEQDGMCLICSRVPKKLVVDHDHSSGVYRGLLCGNCNSGIGFLGENIENLTRAIKYIEHFTANPNEAEILLNSRPSAGYPPVEEILELLKTSNFKEVGKKFGVSGISISNHLKRNDAWTPVLPRIRWPNDAELVKWVEKDGKHEVAKSLGSSESSVVKRVRSIKTKEAC
jgi:hypothetical protein